MPTALEVGALTGRGKPLTVSGMAELDQIGRALQILRERAGLTQDQLAKRAGMSYTSLSRYERAVEAPQVKSLDRILAALGVTLRDLADAIDEASGRTRTATHGRARREWVGVLRDMGISEPVLRGFAFEGYSSGVDVDRIEADLVASAQEAAREIAEAAASYRRDFDREAALEVAEGTPPMTPERRRR